jgi:LacY proton/sugar symporter.
METYFPFFRVWLKMIGLDQADTGYVLSFISLFAILFQPLFGLISDKLGLKNLLWMITFLLVLFGPLFIFIFGPLLKLNVTFSATANSLYLGVVFSALIEKINRQSGFEFGHCRMFNCFGGAIYDSFVGIMISFVGIMISKDINAVY